MFTSFSVKNYKCLADVTLPLTPVHVLIGQNDTGKSSLLEAMVAFGTVCRNPQTHIDTVFATPEKQLPQLVWHGSAQRSVHLEAELRVRPDSSGLWQLKMAFRLDTTEGLQSFKCDDHEFLDGSPPRGYRYVDNRVQRIEQAGDFVVLRFQPKLMALPSAITTPRTYRLQSDGFGLPTLVDEITGFDVQRFIELQSAFCEFFPQFQRIKLEPVEAFARTASAVGAATFTPTTGKEIRLVTKTGEIRLQQASDGVILLLGFLALTFAPNPPRLLLIEEPENGIYPQRLREIAQLLKRFAAEQENAPQIVLTTHSPYLLSEFQPEEVTLMCRQADGSVRARPLRDAPNIRKRMEGGFYLGELWYNLTEQELFGDT